MPRKERYFIMEEKGKKLGLWNIIGLGLGGAIGTGVFVLLGYGVAYTGRSISLVVTIGCFFMLAMRSAASPLTASRTASRMSAFVTRPR